MGLNNYADNISIKFYIKILIIKLSRMFLIKFYIFLFSISQFLNAQPFWETKILSANPQEHSLFGSFVSIENNYLVVGAPLDHSYGSYSGAVYGYEKINGQWFFDQTIRPLDLNSQDRFGSVKLFEGNLYAGARDKEVYGDERGAVYHFVKNDSLWVQVQKIIPLDTIPIGSNFGLHIDVSDQFLMISAELDRENGMQSGSVYVLRQENGQWVQHQKLFPANGVPYQRFGDCITHSSNLLFIGAPEEDNINGDYAGAVYVFELVDSFWVEKDKIINENGAENELFGNDVSVSGNTLAVGMTGSIFSDIPGKVNIYDVENGVIRLTSEIMASDADKDDYFGGTLVLRKDSILVGAPGSDRVALGAGALYLFKLVEGQWREKEIFTASDGDRGDELGVSVDMHKGMFAGGAPNAEDPDSNDIGAVYIFQDSPTSIEDKYLNPEKFYLSQNYPNPFNPNTIIRFTIPELRFTTLKIYDVLGKEITTLVNEEKPAGNYEVEFDGSNLASGIYIYRLVAGKFTDSKKLIFLK